MHAVLRMAAGAGALALAAAGAAADETTLPARHHVECPALRIGLSADGRIVGATFRLAGRQVARAVEARTEPLAGWAAGEVTAAGTAASGLRFEKPRSYRDWRCIVVETFTPAKDSIRWEVQVRHGGGEPFGIDVLTALRWPDPKGAVLWTAWPGTPAADGKGASWNPLTPAPLQNLAYGYGNGIGRTGGICLPIATLAEPADDLALSLVLSPEDVTVGLAFKATADGEVSFSRSHLRLSDKRPVRVAMDLVAHAADWRGGLGWMVRRYPAQFDPPNPAAHEIVGCGTYANYQGDLNAAAFRKMNFRVNWNAHFDWPYQGMNLPLVGDEEQWTSWYRKPASYASMNAYAGKMRAMGFHVLEYFVATEAGNHVKWPAPPRKAKDDADLWKDANDFIYHRIPAALLRKDADSRPAFSNWNANVVVDPGDPAWQALLLAQARRMVAKLPDSSGICIDRMDHLPRVNQRADDGVTWSGGPARSLLRSWTDLMAQLGPILHDAGKIILANPINCRRVDMMRHLDGLYEEYYHPTNIAASALICVRKPVIVWKGPADDAGFQRLLLLGVFPSVPYPGADHNSRGSPDATDAHQQIYKDYGPLFAAIMGKRWLLVPHIVDVVGGKALANVFRTNAGWAVCVVLGGDAAGATVRLRRAADAPPWEKLTCRAVHPGRDAPADLSGTPDGDWFVLDVPLVRGCAVVKLTQR